MGDYHRLMMREHAIARQQYTYDPRQVLTTAPRSQGVVETFNSTQPTNLGTIDPSDYTGIPEGSRSDPSIVQDTPKTRQFKRYVIIDASQRDWLRQPNPFSNLVYTFGSQSTSPSNPPVYTNNQFVPTFALEQQQLESPIPGIPNTQGWTLPAALSGSGTDVSYGPYNSSLTRGNFIAFDTGYLIQPSGSGFGSVFTPSNVSSIRLVRAVLPQRQFFSIPIDPCSSTVDGQTSAFIQSNITDKPYSTFSTYPYLLFYLNEYFGQYVGGNEPMRRSFSVMTQRQRQQTNFQTSVGVQQYDYEPWGAESLQLQSPITNFQRIAITITDPIGTPFAQNDGLSISLIQASDNQMYLKCFTGSFQYFSGNDLRVGDRVTFYAETLSNILKSPVLAALNVQKRGFVNALLGGTFPVLELLDYVPDENGIYVPRSQVPALIRTTPYVASFNGFLIPNFVTVGSDGSVTPTYPQAIDSGTNNILELELLVQSNLPFLNTSLQPVYTLELETQEPDTSSIGGKIVL